MSTILEEALKKAKKLPKVRQEQIGQWVIDAVEQDNDTARLSPEQQKEVTRRMNEPDPIFATDEQVEALFHKLAT